MASFFYCGRLSSAQLDRWQAPKQRPIIDRTRSNRRHTREMSKTMDINPSKEQVVDKGIRQKSTKEWTHSLMAVPFVRGHRTVSPRTPRKHLHVHTYTSSHTMSRPRVACWHGSRQNSQKTECVLRRLPIGGWKKNCGFNGIRCKLVNTLHYSLTDPGEVAISFGSLCRVTVILLCHMLNLYQRWIHPDTRLSYHHK